MAEPSIIAAGITALPVLVASLAQWRDMRRRTNGAGPIAGELKELRTDIADVRAEVRDIKADVRELRNSN